MILGRKIHYITDGDRNIRYIGPKTHCQKLLTKSNKRQGYHLGYPLLDLEEEKKLLNLLQAQELWKWPICLSEKEFDDLLDGIIPILE